MSFRSNERFVHIYLGCVGAAVAQWLRCCATNRKVVGSITNGVIGSFRCHDPSDRTIALESTQPLGKRVSGVFSGGKKRPVRKTDKLTTILGHSHVIWEP